MAEAVKVVGAGSINPRLFVVLTEWAPVERALMRKTFIRSPGPIVTDDGVMVAVGETTGVTTTLAVKSAPCTMKGSLCVPTAPLATAGAVSL